MQKGLIVVNGGSRGIGKAIVYKFLHEGFSVAVCSRNNKNLDALKVEITSENLHVFQADMAIKDQVQAFASFVIGLNLPLSSLIHNAGIFEQSNMLSEQEDTLPNLLNTNVLSAYYLSKFLKEKFEKGTHIFTICSIASLKGYAESGSYATSKFALLGFTKSLRLELQPKEIKVTAILPGATDTDSWAGSGIAPERFIEAADVAEIVWSTYCLGPSAVVEEVLIRPTLGDI
jgi:short-subunit dehydrogenase